MGKGSRNKQGHQKASPPPITTPSHDGLLTHPLAALLLIALLATLIYSNTFSASFHFDDSHNIVDNPKIKDLRNLFDFSSSRYMGFLSFALNYHFGGLNVFGYHLVNLLIHITNGFLVYCLVLLLFKAPTDHGRNSLRPYPPFIALATALLFIAHPIQTQAVTYIVQRFASLAALFYLLTVVCYLKWRLALSEDRSRYLWYGGALISTIMAMKTRENTFTLPFMILLVEWIFFRVFTKKRWVVLIPFLLTLPMIPLSHIDVQAGAEAGSVQETTAISRFDYLFTQFRVIMTYIRLLFLPINQNLDYDYPIYHSLFEPPVFLSFLFLFALFALALYLLFNSKFKTQNFQLIGFGILWFFLTLSIESSIIPITDVIFEHRVYLPSAGFFLTATTLASHLTSRPQFRILFLSFILLILSVVAYQRNRVWENEFTLWKDVVAKAPGQARAHNNLGLGYYGVQRLEDAVQEYQTALKLKPDLVEAHDNLGVAYIDLGRLNEAIEQLQRALKLQPNYAKAHNNLGTVYALQGRLAEAIQEHQIALKLQPNYVNAHYNLGNVLTRQGRFDEAVQAYKTALTFQPDFAQGYFNLGQVLVAQERLEEALAEFQKALKLKPDDAQAHFSTGVIYKDLGRLDEAIQEFQIALRLQPNLVITYYTLGDTYRRKGLTNEAIVTFKQALRIKPDFLPAQKALESLTK